MLRDDEALCVDCVQSFRDRADFDNLNAHATHYRKLEKKATATYRSI